MVDSIRELLEESGNASEEALIEETRATTSRRWAKGWLVISGAIVLVAFGGTAAFFQKDSTKPQHSKRGAMPTNLVDLEEEHKLACDTYFHMEAETLSNLGKVYSSSKEEGLVIPGSYVHAGEDPVALEMHIHAVTEYKHPKNANGNPNEARKFTDTPGERFGKIVMHPEQETKFKVEFVKAGTHDPYTLDQIGITFFDIDGPVSECEGLTLEPANEAVLATDYKVVLDDSQKDEGILTFSNEKGSATIPKRFDKFNDEEQRSHSIEGVFYAVNTFYITLKAGDCNDRWFTFIGRASVQCAKKEDGEDPPAVVIKPAAPIPTNGQKYCTLCFITSQWWAQLFLCSEEPAWWVKQCEA
jgi:hypothetical protein